MKQGCLIFLLGLLFWLPQPAYAILPPDILFSVGVQFTQIFSVILLFIGGLVGSVVLLLRPRIYFIKTHVYPIIGVVLLVGISGVLGIYLLQELSRNATYATQISTLETQLQEVLQTVTNGTSTTGGTRESVHNTGRIFASDTIYLYGIHNNRPLYLEVNLNRKQLPSGGFTHYYFIYGLLGERTDSTYVTGYSSSTKPLLTTAIPRLMRTPYPDASPREAYAGSLIFEGSTVDFTATDLQGDFLTRNTPDYTRHQSVGNGSVRYNNESVPVYALVEGIYSSDYSKSIFFPGFDQVEATSRQFVLWDEAGDFYLIDESMVTSNTPAYPSHSWLLFKQASTGYTAKGFETSISVTARERAVESAWIITAPEFNNATLKLTYLTTIDSASSGRTRAVVSGTISDTTGERTINGFLLLAN